MYSYARNWKWMIPGVGFAALLLLTRFFMIAPYEFLRWTGMVTAITAALCAIAAVGNLIDYRRTASVEMFERRRRAMSLTPLSAELEAARGVHPDVAQRLISERKRAWMLRGQGRYDVLYGAPLVTDIFVRYILENSSESTVMPKRLLVDGKKNRFDNQGAVTEYEMYDDLMKMLYAEGKIHRWSEFNVWEWVAPWNPSSVADDLRLVMDEDEVPSEISGINLQEEGIGK